MSFYQNLIIKKMNKSMITRILIILTISILSILIIGLLNFNYKINKEKAELFFSTTKGEENITMQDIEQLPELIKNYLIKTKALGKCKDCNLILKQRGKIRTDVNKKWLHFIAKQYMSWKHPGFIWKAKSFPMLVRDKYLNGIGEVNVNLLGLKSIGIAKNEKVNQGSLIRYFGELTFYPHGFLDKRITWSEINKSSIKGTLTLENTSVTGTFYFDKDGFVKSFKAKRYKTDSLENFAGLVSDYKTFDGMFIPAKMKAVWNLEGIDFEYFNTTITDYKIQKTN